MFNDVEFQDQKLSQIRPRLGPIRPYGHSEALQGLRPLRPYKALWAPSGHYMRRSGKAPTGALRALGDYYHYYYYPLGTPMGLLLLLLLLLLARIGDPEGTTTTTTTSP